MISKRQGCNILMTNKNNFTYRKRLNTQIITKTELALAAIRRIDMQQSRVNFLKNNASQHKTLLDQLDFEFSKLTPHKKIELQHSYKLNLFAHSQEYYCLEMFNYVFPMRVLIKNVRNDGVLYIGYDQEYPGVETRSKMAIFENCSPEKQKNYDFKIAVSKDMLITLRNKGNQMVRNVYFTFAAGASLMMVDFKVEFIGFERNERVMSQVKFQEYGKVALRDKMRTMADETLPMPFKLGESPESFKQFSRSKPLRLEKIDKNVRLDEFQVMSKQDRSQHSSKPNLMTEYKQGLYSSQSKDSGAFLRANTEGVRVLKNSKLLGLGITKYQKSELEVRQAEAKRNKQMIEIYKAKDKQLKEIASKCKRMIESSQKVYNEESVRKRRLNKDVVLILKSVLFVNRVNVATAVKYKRDQMQYKVLYLCKKFIKNLKRAHQRTVDLLPYRHKRFMLDATSLIGLEARLLYKHQTLKASKFCMGAFATLLPSLMVNNSLNTANSYRVKIKLIQRTWKTKYHSRMSCLLYFVDNHIARMTADFPHLKLFKEQIYITGCNRSICVSYLKDESEKYRFIYEAYLRTVEEIDDMERINQNMERQKGKAKKKFVIPKRPVKPMHRFYRNLDILKSMVRTWFQIEYKKYIKKLTHVPRQK